MGVAALEHRKPSYCPWQKSFLKMPWKLQTSLQLTASLTDLNRSLERHRSESRRLESKHGRRRVVFRGWRGRFGLLLCSAGHGSRKNCRRFLSGPACSPAAGLLLCAGGRPVVCTVTRDDGRFGPLSFFEGEWEGVTVKMVVYYKAGCVPQRYFDSISLGGRKWRLFSSSLMGKKMCPVPYFFQRSWLKLAEGYSSERISHVVAWIFSLGSSSSHRPGGLPLRSAQGTWEPHLCAFALRGSSEAGWTMVDQQVPLTGNRTDFIQHFSFFTVKWR